jgi:putative NIF3 family GTP cyclohydrolase 1 type 2
MRGLRISRRGAGAALAAAAASTALAAEGGVPTARETAGRIARAFGSRWRSDSGDGLVSGRPDMPVTGVAVAVVPTLDVLRRAQAKGLNLVVAFEYPLYRRPGDPPPSPFPVPPGPKLEDDPVYRGKKAFLDRQDVAVFRLHDALAAAEPDLMIQPLASALGWTAAASPDDARRHEAAARPLRTVLELARRKIGAHGGLRYIGDLDLPLRRALVVPGTSEVVHVTQGLPGVDLLVTGDIREWEIVEYLFDSRQAGTPKALVAVGRRLSLQPGMKSVADRLREGLGDLRVELIPATDPFWRLPS